MCVGQGSNRNGASPRNVCCQPQDNCLMWNSVEHDHAATRAQGPTDDHRWDQLRIPRSKAQAGWSNAILIKTPFSGRALDALNTTRFCFRDPTALYQSTPVLPSH